jgi:hypothetical protein
MASENDYESDYESNYKSDYESDYYSDSNSDSDIGVEVASEPTSEVSSTSTSWPKHSIGARIQALSFLELNIPHFEIIAKTRISKAQIYKLREKALLID